MKLSFPLGTVLAAFLAVAVTGCGDQLNNPVAQEQNYSSLEHYGPRRDLRARLLELKRSPRGDAAEKEAETVPLTSVMQGYGELRNDPYKNFRFRVEIDGIIQAGFNEVILPDSTVDVIDETGEGLEVRPRYGNLVLKWGITDSMELYNWHKEALNGNIETKNISVILMDDEGNDRARWDLVQAWPIRYVAPELDAQGNEVAIETLEIAHEGMERVS